jgi:cytochrome c oxidase accessory protein FixG
MVQSTANERTVEQHLYEKRARIYPREVHGIFARLRVLAAVTLLGLYYGLPWLKLGDRQAVLFDLPARKFHIFGLTFWPQDFIYLTLLMILAALTLFFFTTIAGRLWCGYACPQTVWTETFLWIERLVEGNRAQQIRLDKHPRRLNTIARKTLKHGLWIAFALWTGFTFTGYFTPIRDLALAVTSLSVSGWTLFWILFYSFATYGNAGWMREQVCLYMCPYARFQSAMFDRDTLIISYDQKRGEPRKRKPSRDGSNGDCIDCTLCVQACPTGIDIRNGLQYECIGCAACIDACNEVMDKTGAPRGLIRYTTQNSLAGVDTRILRPRVLLYGAVLLTLLGALLWSIGHRNPVAIDIIRDRQSLYREFDDGTIVNSYTLKILNKTERELQFALLASGLPQIQINSDTNPVTVPAGAVQSLAVQVAVHYSKLVARSHVIGIEARSLDDPSLTAQHEASFLGPGGH